MGDEPSGGGGNQQSNDRANRARANPVRSHTPVSIGSSRSLLQATNANRAVAHQNAKAAESKAARVARGGDGSSSIVDNALSVGKSLIPGPASIATTIGKGIAGVGLLNPVGIGVGLVATAIDFFTKGDKGLAATGGRPPDIRSGRGANKGGSGGAAARSLYGADPFGSGSSGRTLQNSAPDQVSPFGDDGGNEDLFKLGTNGPAPSAASKTAASEATSIAKSIAQQQTDAALKKRRQIGGFSLFGSGGSGGSGFLS